MFALDTWLGCHVVGHPGRERLVDGNRLVASQPAWPLLLALGPLQVRVRGTHLRLLLAVLLRIGVAKREHDAGQRQNDPNSVVRSAQGSNLRNCPLSGS